MAIHQHMYRDHHGRRQCCANCALPKHHRAVGQHRQRLDHSSCCQQWQLHNACGIASLALSQTAFVCSEVGANTEILTVTDVNGNSTRARQPSRFRTTSRQWLSVRTLRCSSTTRAMPQSLLRRSTTVRMTLAEFNRWH
jgi:hypothetical protein